MINSLDINNFQSLKAVHLDLGPFTVIVGDSNCGKSALVRSIQGLASNVRGSSVVTHGSKTASVSASTDSSTVTLEKGEGHGCYRLSQGGSEKEFTKLAGEVPSEVSKSLELDPVKEGLSLNFAPQHEPPFLLTASGSAVARSLGELTKVSTVLEAVREANRRRMSASSDLKLRAKDLEGIGNAADILSSLNARKDAIHAADKLMADIKSLETEILKLDSIVGSLEKLDVQVADIYDMSDLLNAYQDFNSLYEALQELHKCTTEVITCTRFYDSWAERSEVLEKELHDTLAEIGECPLCGQEISK